MVLPWGLTDPGYPRLPQSTGADALAATLGNARWCGGAQADATMQEKTNTTLRYLEDKVLLHVVYSCTEMRGGEVERIVLTVTVASCELVSQLTRESPLGRRQAASTATFVSTGGLQVDNTSRARTWVRGQ